MKIGSLRIEPPLLLAPMAGVTDSPFRWVARRLGCPAVTTEMVSAEGLLRGGKGSLELLEFDPAERPLIVQLFGHQPERVAEAARVCEQKGFDAVDINMGCPVKKVVRHGAGAALLRDPERAWSMVEAVRKATSLPITVKMRSGWSQDEIDLLPFARGLVEAGADGLILHPRTRAQFYSGRADWSWIAALAREVPVPVIGNGDIIKVADGRRMIEETGCAGVMVGRASQGNPWLVAAMARSLTGVPIEDSGPGPEERLEVFCIHIKKMIDLLGSETRAVLRMRKHLVWYSRGLAGASVLRRKLFQMRSAREMTEALRSLLFENPSPEHAAQPDDGERSASSCP
jgi:tRNA-dihydrouridine synthase B